MNQKSTPILYISSAKDGHMGVSAPQNRAKYFAKIGINPKNLVDIVVAHSDRVMIATKKDTGKFFEGYDAVITGDKNVSLALTVADCIPIAVFDPQTNSRALIHAGWRGLENGIIQKTIEKIGGKLGELKVFVGPHICKKHYEIKTDVSVKFEKYKKSVKNIKGKIFLDLGSVALEQLLKLGIKRKNIFMDNTCNFESPELFSYRRGDSKYRNLYLLTNKIG